MSLIPTTGLIGVEDVAAAADRIQDRVRRVVLSPVDAGAFGEAEVWFAHEYLQHTGTFKARGAANLATWHLAAGTMPDAGVTIASGGNAGLACAWAAQATGTTATVFIPTNTPAFKVAKLRAYGATIRQVGSEYADALAGSIEFAQQSGALLSHAYDHPLVVAGAGTMAREIHAQLPDFDTLVVAVGGGGLFAGTAAALSGTGKRIVVVEPEHSRALNAALAAGEPVDVPVASVAADSLGARRVSRAAYDFACHPDVSSVLVSDEAIVAARQSLWDHHRIVVEHGGAVALAALASGAYSPASAERVVVVLCGANTDPSDLI
ncbi:MAG TPA: threonine/serine dehydratase [Mycobacteriales bacterium]|nr:threonine/serine dehydratase [Mycobacteriales bacterium]